MGYPREGKCVSGGEFGSPRLVDCLADVHGSLSRFKVGRRGELEGHQIERGGLDGVGVVGYVDRHIKSLADAV